MKRCLHELRWNGEEITGLFLDALAAGGFRPTTVGQVEVNPGERVPAFYIQDTTAYFGWVFWEKFNRISLRKLFGSVVRRTDGEWVITIPPTRQTTIYAHPGGKLEMDIDVPSPI